MWRKEHSKRSSLKYPELVSIYEEKLEKKKLLKERTYADKSRIGLGDHDRFTDLGFKLCEFIYHFDKDCK